MVNRKVGQNLNFHDMEATIRHKPIAIITFYRILLGILRPARLYVIPIIIISHIFQRIQR